MRRTAAVVVRFRERGCIDDFYHLACTSWLTSPPQSTHTSTRTVLAGADLIPEGKCAIYTLGAGKLGLCIESILRFGELTQVRS